MEQEEITVGTTAKVGGLIILGALIINSIIFFIADTQDVFNVQVLGADFAIINVIALTLTFLIGGLIGFYILIKNMNQSVERIRIIAFITVLITLSLPFTISGASTAFRLTLLSMHIITGLITIMGLTTSYLWKKV